MGKYLYLIETLNNLRITGGAILIVIMSAAVAFAMMRYLDAYSIEDFIEELGEIKKGISKKIIIFISFMFLFTACIPSKQTMYAIFITDKVITKENYDMTVEELKNGIDYIFEKIDKEKDK